MLSRKTSLRTRLGLIIILLFNNSQTYGVEDPSLSEQNIIITDFEFYRKINYKDEQLLVYNDANSVNMVYSTTKYRQTFFSKGAEEYSSFEGETAENYYKIYFKDKKMHYVANPKSEHYNDRDANCKILKLNEFVLSYKFKKMLKNLKDKDAIKNTCDKVKSGLLDLNPSRIASDVGDMLAQCTSNEFIQELIKKDPNFGSYSLQIYDRYFRLFDPNKKSEKPIALNCDLNHNTRLGSFDSRSTPPTISLNWTLLDPAKNANSTKDTSNTLTHEFMHSFQPVLEIIDVKNLSCVNEQFVRSFMNLCESAISASVKNQKSPNAVVPNITFPTLQKIEAGCAENANDAGLTTSKTEEKRNNNSGNSKGGGPTVAIVAAQKEDAAKQQAKIKENLASVKREDFVVVKPELLETITMRLAADPKIGEPYKVSVNTKDNYLQGFVKAVGEMNALSAISTSKLASKFEAVAALAAPPAFAAKSNISTAQKSTNYAPSFSESSTKIRDQQTPISTASSASTRNNFPSRSQDVTGNKNDSSLSSSVAKKPNASSLSTSVAEKPNVTSQSHPRVQNPKDISQPNPVAQIAALDSTNNATPQKNRIPASQSPSRPLPDNSIINRAVQELNNTQGKVPPLTYEEVKKQYKNTQFKNLLKTYGLQIMVKDINGKLISIGANAVTAKKFFIDDGNSLTKTPRRK